MSSPSRRTLCDRATHFCVSLTINVAVLQQPARLIQTNPLLAFSGSFPRKSATLTIYSSAPPKGMFKTCSLLSLSSAPNGPPWGREGEPHPAPPSHCSGALPALGAVLLFSIVCCFVPPVALERKLLQGKNQISLSFHLYHHQIILTCRGCLKSLKLEAIGFGNTALLMGRHSTEATQVNPCSQKTSDWCANVAKG